MFTRYVHESWAGDRARDASMPLEVAIVQTHLCVFKWGCEVVFTGEVSSFVRTQDPLLNFYPALGMDTIQAIRCLTKRKYGRWERCSL